MKTFAAWLLLCTITFGGLAGGYHWHLEANPRKVLVAVDASFPMGKDWRLVSGLLDGLDDEPYAEFSLFSDKSRVHSWAPELTPGKLNPYAPRDLRKLANSNAPEMAQAHQRVLITNAAESELSEFDTWVVVRPQ